MSDPVKDVCVLEEEEDKSKLYCNNVLQHNSRITISFSVKAQYFPILSEFKKVSKRESGSRGFSLTVLKAMVEFNRKHGVGNNQIKISNYVVKEPTPSAHLCRTSAGNTNDGQVFCFNPSMIPQHERSLFHGISGKWVSGITCYSCKFNKLRRTP